MYPFEWVVWILIFISDLFFRPHTYVPCSYLASLSSFFGWWGVALLQLHHPTSLVHAWVTQAFQGAVPNPREPGSSLAYSSRSGLESDVMKVLGMMRRPETAAIIAKELAPFFSAQYYYMFNYFNFSAANISGVAGYKEQTLSMIGAGFQGSIGAVELQFGDTILV